MEHLWLKITMILLVLSFKATAWQNVPINNNVASAMQVVQANDIKADITYLADDKLKGRLPGTEGYQLAADYVIARLKTFGVLPAGEHGGWTQQVRLRKAFTAPGAVSKLTAKGHTDSLLSGKDIALYPNPLKQQQQLSAAIVFAGFGIANPGLGYDDYANIDVKGKIVLILRGAPDNFPSSIAAHSMDALTILKTAAEHGAAGVLIGFEIGGYVPDLSKGVYSVMDAKGDVAISRSYYSNQLKVFGFLNGNFLAQLFNREGKSVSTVVHQLKAGTPSSFATSALFAASYTSYYADVNSFNVIGKIPGSDRKLANQFVVHSAHLDHLGISTPVQGDSLYNGAHDNASGVASLLQIAKIYSQIKIKPKRSVLVAFVTGEELGLLGSGYFAKYPTVSQKQIVADINTDMPTIIAPLLSITPLGAEHSSLSKQVDIAATYLGLSVEADPEPKQNRFVRSDQYSFVLQGIPSLHIKYGNRTPDGKNNLNEFVEKWRAKYYHKPQDDINGIFDFEAGKKYAQLNFLIGYLVANDPDRPSWNNGDIFDKR